MRHAEHELRPGEQFVDATGVLQMWNRSDDARTIPGLIACCWATKAQFPSLDSLGFDRGAMNRGILDDFTTSTTTGVFGRKARRADLFNNQNRMIWEYYVTLPGGLVERRHSNGRVSCHCFKMIGFMIETVYFAARLMLWIWRPRFPCKPKQRDAWHR